MTDKVVLVRVHKHVLTLVNAAEKYAVKLGTKEWICKTCNRLSMELKRKKSYHCAQCSFDICLDCMKQLKSPKHEHHLQVTDMLTLADNAMWICHGCGVNGRFQGQYAWRCGSCNYHLCHGCTRDKKCFMHEHDLTKSNPMKAFPEQTSWKCNLCCYVYSHADEEKPYSCRECSPPFAICGTCLSAFLDTEENEKTAAQITLDKENESSSGGLLATYRIVNGQKVESHSGLTSTKGTCKKRSDQVEFTKDSEIQRRSMSADARTRVNGVMEPQKENQRRSSSADATRAIRIKAKRDRNEKRRPASTNEIPIFGRKSKERKLVNCRDSRERRKAVSGTDTTCTEAKDGNSREPRGRLRVTKGISGEDQDEMVYTDSGPRRRVVSTYELAAGGNKSTDVKDKIQSDARSRSRAATTGSGLGLISVVPATADTSTQGKDQRQSDARVRRRAAMAKAESTTVNINLKVPQKLERNKDVQVIEQIVEDENVKKSASASKPLAFISYQWNIQDKVLKLREYLEANKIPCWIDIGNMGGGDELKKEIDKGIRGAKFIISCVTVAYTESKTCQQEVALADALRKPILPILMEPLSWPPVGSMAMPFAPLIYVDCKETKCGDDFKKVLESIKQRVLVNQL